MATVKLAQASIDERGKAFGGKAGNQNGRELNIVNWYDHPWHTVLRAKTKSLASKIATNAILGVNNKHIGYDQRQRTTLYKEAEKVDFKLNKITVDCETDCSAFVSVVVNASGVEVSKDMYTGNEVNVLNATKQFQVLRDKQYVTKSDNLEVGDILVGNGHTAIVCNVTTSAATKAKAVPVNNQEIQAALLLKKSYAGAYKAIVNLNLRSSVKSNIDANIITVVPRNSIVRCYGYYNVTGSNVWLLVVYTDSKGNRYTGYIIKDKLHKQ